MPARVPSWVANRSAVLYLDRFLRRCPGALRLGGHQQPCGTRRRSSGTLQENLRTSARPGRGRHGGSSLTPPRRSIHIWLRSATPSACASARPREPPVTPAARDALSFDIAGEAHLPQEIVGEALAHAGCAGRSLSRRARASALPSRRRYRGRVSVRRCRHQGWRHEGVREVETSGPCAPIWSSPILSILIIVYTYT